MIKFNSEEIMSLRNVYCCTGQVWTFCDRSALCTSVSHSHLDGKRESNVEFLDFFQYNSGPRLPRSIEKFFPNLRGLQLSYGTLEEISFKDLRYPKLEYLRLNNNKLRTLDSDVFKFLPRLAYLTLDTNKITNVGNFLDSLNNLRMFFINDNPCTLREQRMWFVKERRNAQQMRGRENLQQIKSLMQRLCPETQQMKSRVKENQNKLDNDDDLKTSVFFEVRSHLTPMEQQNKCRKYFTAEVESEVSTSTSVESEVSTSTSVESEPQAEVEAGVVDGSDSLL